MAISQTKQVQLTTPEAVYDQPPALRPNGTNSGKNGLSVGAITGLAVGGVVACALSFVVGMQVGGSQNSGMNSQAARVDKRAAYQVVARIRLVKTHKRQRRRVATALHKITKLLRRHRLAQHSRQPPTPRSSPINRW